jgi:hypothetical protein
MSISVISAGSPHVSFNNIKDAPKPGKVKEWVKSDMKAALEKCWMALALNVDGLRHYEANATVVVRHNKFKAPIMEALEALVRVPLSNSTKPEPTALRQAIKAIKDRLADMPTGAIAVEVEFKGTPGFPRPTMVQLANKAFVAAGMGELRDFRNTDNGNPSV